MQSYFNFAKYNPLLLDLCVPGPGSTGLSRLHRMTFDEVNVHRTHARNAFAKLLIARRCSETEPFVRPSEPQTQHTITERNMRQRMNANEMCYYYFRRNKPKPMTKFAVRTMQLRRTIGRPSTCLFCALPCAPIIQNKQKRE